MRLPINLSTLNLETGRVRFPYCGKNHVLSIFNPGDVIEVASANSAELVTFLVVGNQYVGDGLCSLDVERFADSDTLN
jgi:hypothetical protein